MLRIIVGNWEKYGFVYNFNDKVCMEELFCKSDKKRNIFSFLGVG